MDLKRKKKKEKSTHTDSWIYMATCFLHTVIQTLDRKDLIIIKNDIKAYDCHWKHKSESAATWTTWVMEFFFTVSPSLRQLTLSHLLPWGINDYSILLFKLFWKCINNLHNNGRTRLWSVQQTKMLVWLLTVQVTYGQSKNTTQTELQQTWDYIITHMVKETCSAQCCPAWF